MAGFMEKSISFIQNFIPSSKKFVADTISELKKSSWPPKNELMESTLLVMVSVVILGLFVAGIDWLIMLGLSALVTK
jgi:preprotein translocase SecE subunit